MNDEAEEILNRILRNLRHTYRKALLLERTTTRKIYIDADILRDWVADQPSIAHLSNIEIVVSKRQLFQ